jgi:hypothetical protein
MPPYILTSLLTLFLLAEPSKLQLIEEAIDRVLLTNIAAYEKGKIFEAKLSDVTITYTGTTSIDAKQDSSVYYVYGSYTFAKYSYIQTPNPLTGTTTGRTNNTNGLRSYIARVKPVLDDYRVQEIIIIDEPDKFQFEFMEYDSLKLTSDWIYPTLVYRRNEKKKE